MFWLDIFQHNIFLKFNVYKPKLRCVEKLMSNYISSVSMQNSSLLSIFKNGIGQVSIKFVSLSCFLKFSNYITITTSTSSTTSITSSTITASTATTTTKAATSAASFPSQLAIWFFWMSFANLCYSNSLCVEANVDIGTSCFWRFWPRGHQFMTTSRKEVKNYDREKAKQTQKAKKSQFESTKSISLWGLQCQNSKITFLSNNIQIPEKKTILKTLRTFVYSLVINVCLSLFS